MSALLIKTDKTNGEVDLTFFPREDESRLLEELHDSVLDTIDGASTKADIRDAVVAIRKSDFTDVVARLADVYRSKSFDVTVE